MKSLGLFVYALAGLISFFWSMSIIVDEAGFLGGLIAFFLFPVTIIFAPLYHGFSSGDWTLAAITYGGGILAAIISGLDSDGTLGDASAVEQQAESSVGDPANVERPSASEPNTEEVATTDQHDLQSIKDPAAPVWLVIFGLFAAWKASETNLKFALAYCGAYFVTGLCLAGAFWLFSSKARSSWSLGKWLNNGSYSMIAFLILGVIVRIAVENTVESQETGVHQVAAPSAPINDVEQFRRRYIAGCIQEATSGADGMTLPVASPLCGCIANGLVDRLPINELTAVETSPYKHLALVEKVAEVCAEQVLTGNYPPAPNTHGTAGDAPRRHAVRLGYPPPPAEAHSLPQDEALAFTDIQRMQTLLRELGYGPGPSDGKVGPRTIDAIERYQAAQGVATTGEPTATLLKRLERSYGRSANYYSDSGAYPEERRCVRKPVMSDADYRACGLNPPPSQ